MFVKPRQLTLELKYRTVCMRTIVDLILLYRPQFSDLETRLFWWSWQSRIIFMNTMP